MNTPVDDEYNWRLQLTDYTTDKLGYKKKLNV